MNYFQRVKPSKAVFVVKEVIQEEPEKIFKTKGMGCAIFFQKRIVLLTSSAAVKANGNRRAFIAERFSRKNVGKYQLYVSVFMECGNFTLLNIDEIIKVRGKNDWLVCLKFGAPDQETLKNEANFEARSFSGEKEFALHVKYDTKSHKPSAVTGKTMPANVDMAHLLGAPIIIESKDNHRKSSDRFTVIGVMGLASEEKPCPQYLENELDADHSGPPPLSEVPSVSADANKQGSYKPVNSDAMDKTMTTKKKQNQEQVTQDFKHKLLQIAENITSNELARMKFICDLPDGVKEPIENPCEFFNKLLARDKIHQGNVEYLVWLLEKTENLSLAQRVKREMGPSAVLVDSNFGKLPPLTNGFIGRESVVNEIVSKLTRKQEPFRMVVILSIPGLGKTQAAIKVGHDLLEQNRPVIYIDEQESLAELCDEIIHRISGWYLSESHDLVRRAKEKLKAFDSDVVIILDNTEGVQEKEGIEFDALVKYVVEKAPAIQLIITTKKDVGFTSWNVHKELLNPLDCHSCALLIQRSVSIIEKNAQKIGELCGGIPLLLVHCVALLKNSFSSDALIRWLKENPIQLLQDNAEPVYIALGGFLVNMPNSMLENLIQVSEFPSSFSVKDLSQIYFDGNEQVSETVKAKMVGCSLLQRMGDEKYALHPLVRKYCRGRREILKMEEVGKSAQDKFNRHFIEKLKKFSKDFVTKNSASVAISSFRENKANIMEALSNYLDEKSSAEEMMFGVDVAISTEVLDFLSKVLTPPAECLKFYDKCYGIARDSGDQRRIAGSLIALGFRHLCDVAHLRPNQHSLDKFKEAKEIFDKLSREQQNCQAHALILCKLGLCFCLQGEESEKGLDLIQKGIKLKKELDVPLYLAAGYCDLGNAHCILGDHQKAIDIWEKETLPTYQNQLGEHPWTATTLHFIAVSYTAVAQKNVDGAVKNSRIDGAVKNSRNALTLRKKLLGFHQETARSHVLLSDALELQNDFKSALKELEEALEIQKEVLGENHSSTKGTQAKMTRIASMQDSK